MRFLRPSSTTMRQHLNCPQTIEVDASSSFFLPRDNAQGTLSLLLFFCEFSERPFSPFSRDGFFRICHPPSLTFLVLRFVEEPSCSSSSSPSLLLGLIGCSLTAFSISVHPPGAFFSAQLFFPFNVARSSSFGTLHG